MSSIFDLAQLYLSEKQKVDELEQEVSNTESDAFYIKEKIQEKEQEYDTLKSKIFSYLKKTDPVLKKIAIIYESEGIEYDTGHVYLNGGLPKRPVQYDEKECFNVANFCVENINSCIRAAANDSFGLDEIRKLCICHFTLTDMLKSIDQFKISISKPLKARFEKDKKEKILVYQNKKVELEDLKEQIAQMADVYKSFSENKVYQNKIFLGYKNTECSLEVKRLLKKEFGFVESDFFKEPVLLGLQTMEKNVAFFENVNEDEEFEEFLKAIYFRNATNFNSHLKIVRIASEGGFPASESLFDEVRSGLIDAKGKEISIENVIINLESGSMSNDDLFETLLGYRNNKIKNLEEYNATHELSLKDYMLVFIDNFPGCIDNEHKKKSFLKLIHDSARMGFFFIINGKYKEQFYSKDFSENENSENLTRSFSIKNGNIALFDFKDKKYSFEYLNDQEIKKCKVNIFLHNRKLQTFLTREKKEYLGSLLDENAKYKPNDIGNGISIPVGFTEDGDVYYFSTNTKANPFAVLTGNTGSGKTAFLHTLILCGALKYSPDELQFYIVDFKDKTGSADFDQYTYRKGERNLYIPHVKYLSTKASKESAFDVLNLINQCASENLKKIKAAGFQNFGSYNSSASVKEKIPQKYFIIDEYATMIAGGEGVNSQYSDSNRIQATLADTLRRIRTSGVGLIFSGQRSNILSEDSFAYFKNQIVFDLGLKDTDEIRVALNLSTVEVSSKDAKRFYKYVANKQGYAISRKLSNVSCVHSLYCGDIGSEDVYMLADLIRKRCGKNYSTKQIVPGADKLENIASFLKEDISQKENRVLTFTDDDNIRVESEYDLGLKLALYFGITNTTAVPTALKFYGTKPNYLVYANNKKISKLSSDVIASILYETRTDKIIKNISYVCFNPRADEREKKQAVDEVQSYCDNFDFAKKRINIISSPQLAIEELMRLYDIYRERKMAFNNSSRIDTKTPYFLVINKLDWMFDEDIISTLHFEKPIENEKVEEDIDIDDEELSLEDLEALGFSSEDTAVMENVGEKTSVQYRVIDIANAIYAILENGPAYNIFAVMGFGNKKILNKLTSQFALSNLVDYKSLVLGSYQMISSLEVKDFGETLNSVYICTENDNSVVRLYDYSIKNSSEWWDILQKDYGRRK